MDFALDARQRTLVEEIGAAAGELARAAGGHTPSPARAAHLWEKAARAGLTGLCLPSEHGGRGLSALDTALSLEAMTRAGLDTGTAFALAAHQLACGVPVRDHAAPGERVPLLAALSQGGAIAANAMTEDHAGSDTTALTTRATAAGNGWTLDGEKSWVSNAPVADLVVVYALTDPAAGYLGMSAFAVDRDTPGLGVGAPLDKPGLHGCLAARVTFEDCWIPAGRILGSPGDGHRIFAQSMLWERACLPAIYLGTMETDLRSTIQHVRTRRQFGRRLADHQAVAHRVAAMAQRLEAARWQLYRACWLLDHDPSAAVAAAAMSKMTVAEAATTQALDSIHLRGAHAYTAQSGCTSQLLDAVPAQLFSGTTEMQLEILAGELLS